MPQIFRRSANTLSKLSLFGVLSIVGSLILLAMVLGRSSYVTRQHEVIEQPLQFSHLHHVLDDGIDCRYCHTSVETSPFAGIPPTKTCMNCHSQLFSTEPILEPVRASFRDDKPLHWVRDLPRPRRPDAADAAGQHAADGVVPELPSESRELRQATQRDHHDGV